MQPVSNPYAGEVAVALGGQPLRFRFGINTLRDYSALTGGVAGGFAADLQADYLLALTNLVYCAVKRYVPASQLPENFAVDTVADWLDEITATDSETLATALKTCLNPVSNPLVAALLKQAEAPKPETGGMMSLTSA